MSDVPFYDVTFPRPKRVGDTWSVKKIIEQVTGKRLEELQEQPRRPVSISTPAPTLPLFLPSTRDEEVAPDKVVTGTKRTVAIVRVGGRKKKLSEKELERKYLAYLMLHMETLTEPALKYLRHAVEEECRERGMEIK